VAIFGEIGKKITQTTQNAVKGTKDFADTARYNTHIADEERLLSSFYAQLGKKYYEMHSGSPDEAFSSVCALIAESTAKIAGFKDEIQKLKGVKKCSGCGGDVPAGTVFCGVCGYDTREASPKCPNCNKELEDNASFCTDCGQKI
jgi:hypothetical protein